MREESRSQSSTAPLPRTAVHHWHHDSRWRSAFISRGSPRVCGSNVRSLSFARRSSSHEEQDATTEDRTRTETTRTPGQQAKAHSHQQHHSPYRSSCRTVLLARAQCRRWVRLSVVVAGRQVGVAVSSHLVSSSLLLPVRPPADSATIIAAACEQRMCEEREPEGGGECRASARRC